MIRLLALVAALCCVRVAQAMPQGLRPSSASRTAQVGQESHVATWELIPGSGPIALTFPAYNGSLPLQGATLAVELEVSAEVIFTNPTPIFASAYSTMSAATIVGPAGFAGSDVGSMIPLPPFGQQTIQLLIADAALIELDVDDVIGSGTVTILVDAAASIAAGIVNAPAGGIQTAGLISRGTATLVYDTGP